MHTLPHHYERLLKAVQPPDNRLDAARDLPPKVRDYLKGCSEVVTVARTPGWPGLTREALRLAKSKTSTS